MEYRRLGRTGVTVSNLCLGVMMPMGEDPNQRGNSRRGIIQREEQAVAG